MKLFELAKVMIFAIPLGIFATLTALLFVINVMKARRLEANYNKVFFFYFFCATLSSVLFFAYYFFPAFFKSVDFLYCGTVVFTVILFHKFHCVCIGSEKRFNPLHYIVPAIVVCAIFLARLFFSEYLSHLNYDLTFYTILLFSAFYVILGLMEMHRFYIKHSITYGSTATINHSRVILLVLEKLMFPTVFGLFPFIGGQHPGPFVSILLMAAILAALYNNIPLVYAIIRYVTLNDVNRSLFDAIQLRRLSEDVVKETVSPVRQDETEKIDKQVEETPEIAKERPAKRIYRKYSQSHRVTGELIEIDKATFESYIRKNKPYMNPHLTIEDLIMPLNSNRVYISKFINLTYKMNFNKYINTCRLKEMERLLAKPGNRNKTPAAIFSQAGFGSYRNYLLAKKNFKPQDPK